MDRGILFTGLEQEKGTAQCRTAPDWDGNTNNNSKQCGKTRPVFSHK